MKEILKRWLGINELKEKVELVDEESGKLHERNRLKILTLGLDIWKINNPPEFKKGDTVYLDTCSGYVKGKVLHHIVLSSCGYDYRVQETIAVNAKHHVSNYSRNRILSESEAKEIINQLK